MWVGGSEGRHQIPGHGGAVFASRADRTPFAPSARWRLLAVRFEGNSAAGMGGAVYSAGVAMTLARCTFIGNAADHPGWQPLSMRMSITIRIHAS